MQTVRQRLKSGFARLLEMTLPHGLTSNARFALAMALPIRSYHGTEASESDERLPLEDLINRHFSVHSSLDHPNRESLTRALTMLEGRPARILETGSSAWGVNSSRLFDSYVRRFGGSFQTIDIRSAAGRALRKAVSPQTELIVGDSLKGIRWVAAQAPAAFDLVYLDSFDLDVDDPIPSMVHGLAEFLWLETIIAPGSLILIDDTPRDDIEWQRISGKHSDIERASTIGRIVPGKGALVAKFVDRTQFEVISHDYQLLLRKL